VLVRRMLVCLALHQLDGVVDQVRVEVLDLLLRELDLLEARHDLVVGEEPLLQTVLYQLVKLFDVGKRDVDGEHVTSRLVCCACLRTYLETTRAGVTVPPAHPLAATDVTRELARSKHIFHRIETVAAKSHWSLR